MAAGSGTPSEGSQGQPRGDGERDATRNQRESDPIGFNTTALVSQPDRRRLRVRDYRVIYTIDNGELVVWVVQVGHRSTVYDT
ncbi:type II toxin-antitoxin system RelE/ParE family toxin [Streptomyces sp. NPDC051677]|uniref:type II toxin-antitoxin system RelE/ParE family toxin n=1 Tax=Streptomyces sp. NPDC051677 TaxID=3365669 RepID=UPI0037D6B218